MAADAWKVYDSFVPDLSTALTDTFYIALFTSSHTPAQTDDSYAALTGEVANGLGYTTGGQALTSLTLTDTAGVTTLGCDTATWTATGGSITARYAIIYNYTDAGTQLVAMCLLDNSPSDVTALDTFPLAVAFTNGILTISGGW